VAALVQVPAQDKEERQAEFFSAACRMHQGELAAAGAGLRKVMDEGDSPQQESALYYLAQIALARNDPAGAHRYLLRTISLRGDLERRARLQDQKVLAVMDREREAAKLKDVK
jgi:outer membrane PBP1 activator LpoA protein